MSSVGSWFVPAKRRVGHVIRIEAMVTAARVAGLPQGVARDLVTAAMRDTPRLAIAMARASGAVVLSDKAASDLAWAFEEGSEG